MFCRIRLLRWQQWQENQNADAHAKANCSTDFLPQRTISFQPDKNMLHLYLVYKTLKKALNILLLSYYCFGTFCLPMGDLGAIVDIPEMYRLCKATEQADMTSLDFFTDHLINIDGIFDKHNNGDEQKPHKQIPKQHHGQTTLTFVTYYPLTFVQFQSVTDKLPSISDNFIPSEYISRIFRPPIV